jgi:hypothetical protein
MEKYKFLLILALSLGFAELSANFDSCNSMSSCESDYCYERDKCSEKIDNCDYSQFEFKAGYFSFLDKNLRRVYSDGGYELQLSYAYRIINYVNVYGSVGYVELTGHSFGLGQETKFQEIPLDLGVQPFYDFTSHFRIYGTVGLSYILAFQRNYSDFVDSHLNENDIGGFLNVGMLYRYNRFFIDLFGEVTSCEMRFHPHKDQIEQGHSINVGGYSVGSSIGLFF